MNTGSTPRLPFSRLALANFGVAALAARPTLADLQAVHGGSPLVWLAVGFVAVATVLIYVVSRQRADTRRRDAEQNFRDLVEQSPAIVYLDEVGGPWRYLSPKVEEVLGYPVADLAAGRERWLVHVASEDRERVREQLQGEFREGQSVGLEYRMIRRSGELAWIRDEARAARDPDRGAWLLRGVAHDITASKRAEIERQALLQIMQGLVSVTDSSDYLRLVHQAVCRVMLAESFYTLLHDPATGRFTSLYADAGDEDTPLDPDQLDRGVAAHVFRTDEALALDPPAFDRLLADGVVATAGRPAKAWLGAPLRGRERTLGVLAVQNYTAASCYTDRDRDFLVSVAAQVAVAIERQQADEALRDSEARFRLISENLAESVWTVDAETLRITYASPSTERVRGLTPQEAMEQTLDQVLTPASLAKALRLLAERPMVPGLPPHTDELEQYHKDGSVLLTEVTTSFALDKNGRIQIVGVSRDITERRRAEEALQRSQRNLEMAQAVAHLGSWELDVATGAGVWSDEMYRLFRRDPALGVPPLHEFLSWVAPGDRDALLAAQARAFEKRESVRIEYRTQIDIGEESHFEAILSPVVDEDGRLVRMVGTALDITRRKRAEVARRQTEAALLANEARLREAQRIANLGVWELDLKRNLLTWSDEIYRIFGVTPQSFAATYEAFLERVHPEDREIVNHAYTRSLATREPYEADHRLLLDDGTVKYVHERCETWYDDDGMPLRSVGTVQDVTEAKRATEQIRLLSRVVEQMEDTVLITDVAGRIEYVNPAFERQLGYSRDEAIGSNPRLLKSGLEPPEVYQRLWATILRGETFQAELRNRRKDGELIDEAKTITPIRDDHGRIVRFVATGRNVTAR